MAGTDADDFVKQELRAGKRKRIEWRALQGLVVSGLAIGVALYLRETISPLFQLAIYGLLVTFILYAGIGVIAGIVAEWYY